MSYLLSIVPTKFEDVRDGTVTYGVRYYDDCTSGYDNFWDDVPGSDRDVLKRCLDNDYGELTDALAVILMNSSNGLFTEAAAYVCCGDTYFTPAELRQLQDEVLEKGE